LRSWKVRAFRDGRTSYGQHAILDAVNVPWDKNMMLVSRTAGSSSTLWEEPMPWNGVKEFDETFEESDLRMAAFDGLLGMLRLPSDHFSRTSPCSAPQKISD
jgi:hypothetical protein